MAREIVPTRRLLARLSAIAVSLCLATSGATWALAETISVLATTPATAALASELAASFAEMQPGGSYQSKFGPAAHQQIVRVIGGDQERGRIAIDVADPAKGLEALISGRASVVISSTPLPLKAGQRLSPDSERVIGVDGLAVIVNRANPLADTKRFSPFSINRLARIVAGEVGDWSELGGERGPIRLHLPSEKSAPSGPLDALILQPHRKRAASGAMQHFSGSEIAAAVGRDRGALGIVAIGDTGSTVALPIGLSCGLIYQPNSFSVQSEAYPLVNRIYAYTLGQPADPLAAEFVQFVSSTAANEAIRNSGMIDTVPRVEEQQDTISWIDAAVSRQETPSARGAASVLRRLTKSYLRTTSRVHFAAGTAEFSGAATDEMGILARLLGSDEMRSRNWLLLGFADGVADWRASVELAARRTAAVLQELEKNGLSIDRKLLMSFGSLGNVGCGNEAAGAHRNQRVELWVQAQQ